MEDCEPALMIAVSTLSSFVFAGHCESVCRIKSRRNVSAKILI